MNVISATPNNTDLIEADFSLSVLSVEKLLKNLIPNFKENVLPAKKQNVRRDLMNELYQIYVEACNKEYYVKNKKRYYAFCKSTHPDGLRDRRIYDSYKSEFRTAKLPDHQKYLKPLESKDYQWWHRFSHLQGEEGCAALRHMISVAKSMVHRKENVIPYILGSVKANEIT